ncbi:hypothetical protein [Stieleria marina]|uniref:Cytochrome C n=1 Tax=Stieleria marina TaxID=1930275 RepID=A0A517NXN3_9BACT|nr:hypothetical protein K239x_38940 [Planctomycetes bacterium K23_9]
MKRFIACLLSCAVLSLSISMVSQADPPEKSVNESQSNKLTPLMRMKLDKSKSILEGLTLEDFDKIKSGARALRLLSTELGWNVIQTPEYAAQSRDFQRATDLIAAAAEDKDIHRATMGYVALTVRCVECHSYMRKHRIDLTRLDGIQNPKQPHGDRLVDRLLPKAGATPAPSATQ